jgi:hypothetical protein
LKKLIGSDVGSYVFDPTNRTITVSGVRPFNIENVLLISNAGTMIYNFADSSLGGSVAENVITLTYDTTSMSADDHLQIWIDIPKERLLESEQYGIDPEYSYDTGLNEVFGSNPITDGDAIKTAEKSRILRRVDGRFNAVGQELRIDCEGANTIGIHLYGAWVGSIAFEGSMNGADFVAIPSMLLSYNSSNPTYSQTTSIAITSQNGIYIATAAGVRVFRIRMSAYTSGTLSAILVADSAKPPLGPVIQTTYDYTLVGSIGAQSLYTYSDFLDGQIAIPTPTINIAKPSSYTDNKYAFLPQRFRRLREIGRAHV